MASASFQIKPPGGVYGAADTAQACTHLGGTVNCKIVDVSGLSASDIEWVFHGTHANGVSAPTPTLSGNPTGQIMSFPFPAGRGQGYGVTCEARGGIGRPNGDTKKSAAYSVNDQGRAPFFVSETLENDPTHGMVTRLNAISNAAGGGSAGDWKESSRLVTVAAMAAYTRTANVILANAVGAWNAAWSDTIAPAVGDLIALDSTGTANNIDNGLWYFTAVGGVAEKFRLERAPLADETGEITPGMTVRIEEGATKAGHIYRCSNTGVITMNTTAITLVDGTVAGAGTDHHLVRWDGTALLQDSLAILDDAGALSLPGPIAIGADPSATGTAVNLSTGATVYGKDSAGNQASLVQWLEAGGSEYFLLGEGTHVDKLKVRAAVYSAFETAGIIELMAGIGYVGFGDGIKASVGTTRYEKDTAACFRNNAGDDDFAAWQTSDDGADAVCKLGGIYGTADRPKYCILDSTDADLCQIAGATKHCVTATYVRYGEAADCSATGTHRYGDNVSHRWLSAAADYGAVTWTGTTLTIGGANATRPTWIYADASTAVELDVAGNQVLTIAAALITVSQDFRVLAGKDVDCYTNGGYLKPRYTIQAGVIAPDANEAMAQKDTGGGPAWYWVVETPDGTKKVALT